MPPKKLAKAAPAPAKKAASPPPPPAPAPKKAAAKADSKAAGKRSKDDDDEPEPVQSPSPAKRIATRSSDTSERAPNTAAGGPAQSPVQVASSSWTMVSKPSPDRLTVPYDGPTASSGSFIAEGLVKLRRAGRLCDATIVAASGRITVHRAVLAAHSETLATRLQEPNAELDLRTFSHESADFVVRWLYGEVEHDNYVPSTSKVNEEVLQISSDFSLPLLAELCALKLSANVDTTNVVARIRLCEEFGLPRLRAALVSALIKDRKVLDAVAKDPTTLTHPGLMRELLASIAAAGAEAQDEEDEKPSSKRK